MPAIGGGSTQTSVATRVPYWFGVPGNAVAGISTLLYDSGPYSTGDATSLMIRTTDVIGMPFDAGAPQVSITGVRASAGIASAGDIPGTSQISIRIGRADMNGLNVVTVTSGSLSKSFPLGVQ